MSRRFAAIIIVLVLILQASPTYAASVNVYITYRIGQGNVGEETLQPEQGSVLNHLNFDVPAGYKVLNSSLSYEAVSDSWYDVELVRDTDLIAIFKFDTGSSGETLDDYYCGVPSGSSVPLSAIPIPLGYELTEQNVTTDFNVVADGDTFTLNVRKMGATAINIKYVNDSGQTVEIQTLSKQIGSTLDIGELILPSGYQLKSAFSSAVVTKLGEIFVISVVPIVIPGNGQTIAVEFTYGTQLVGTQSIQANAGDYINSAKLSVPAGYKLSDVNYSYTVVNSTTIQIPVVVDSSYINQFTVNYIRNYDSEPIALKETGNFLVGTSYTFRAPETTNGYSLVDVRVNGLVTNGLNRGALTLTLSSVTPYTVDFIYSDTEAPKVTLKSGVTAVIGSTVKPSDFISYVSDNSNDALTMTFLGSGESILADRNGFISEVIRVIDKSGNYIDLPVTFEVKSVSACTVNVTYRDENRKSVGTQVIESTIGTYLDVYDLTLPNWYYLEDNDWEYYVRGATSINVDVVKTTGSGNYTASVYFLDNSTGREVSRQQIKCNKNQTLDWHDLKIPSKYDLVDRAWEHTVKKDNEKIDVYVSLIGGSTTTSTAGNFTVKVNYYDQNNQIVGTQTIANVSAVTSKSLKLPTGYSLRNNFKDILNISYNMTIDVGVKSTGTPATPTPTPTPPPTTTKPQITNPGNTMGKEHNLYYYYAKTVSGTTYEKLGLNERVKILGTSFGLAYSVPAGYRFISQRTLERGVMAVEVDSIDLSKYNPDSANVKDAGITGFKASTMVYVSATAKATMTNSEGALVYIDSDGSVYANRGVGGVRKAFMSGKSENSFDPTGTLTRGELAVILFNTMSDFNTSYTGQGKKFSDVPGSYFGADAIAFVSKYDLMIGYPDGTFKPNGAITRAEMATVASKFYSYSNTAPKIFNAADVQASAWYYKPIKSFYERGYMTLNSSLNFYPDRKLTRAEAAATVGAMLSRVPSNNLTNKFTDINLSNAEHYSRNVLDAVTTYIP